MKLYIRCGTGFGENEDAVLAYLQKCQSWPTAADAAAATGLTERAAAASLRRIASRLRPRPSWTEQDAEEQKS